MIEYKIGYLLRQLNSSMIQYGAGKAKIPDITPTQSLLLYILLKEGKDGICSSDICAESGLSRATVSGMLKLLRKNGYVTMECTPEDERRKKIVLTEKAYAIQDDVEQELKRQGQVLCRGISEHDLLFLEDILQKMNYNLREDIDWSA